MTLLSTWLDYEIDGYNSVENWLISLAIIGGTWLTSKVVYWIIRRVVKAITAKTKTRLDDILVEKLERPVVFGVVLASIWYALSLLHFTNDADKVRDQLFEMAIVLNITWLIARIVDALIEEYLVPIVEKSESELDDQILPIARKALRSVIWVFGVIISLQFVGIDVSAMLAGLGIGGLALALAAQDSVKNIFGGIMIFLDKPFKIGDRIIIQGYDGIVHEVGLRSTRIKKLDGRLVTMPNSTFAENSVENVSAEPSRKVSLSLGLTYDTTPAQMKEAVAILNQITEDHKDMLEQDTWTVFDTYGDFAMAISYSYFIKKDQDIPTVQTHINSVILERFTEKGLEFAFPTQTLLNYEMSASSN